MFIHEGRVNASIATWKKATRPDALARALGEASRASRVSGSQRRHRLRELFDQARDPVVARTLLERIIEGNDLVGVNYLLIGAARAHAVCRIHLCNGAGSTVGYGTGF